MATSFLFLLLIMLLSIVAVSNSESCDYPQCQERVLDFFTANCINNSHWEISRQIHNGADGLVGDGINIIRECFNSSSKLISSDLVKLTGGEIEVPTLTKTLTNFNISSGTTCSFIGCARLPPEISCRVSETPSCTYTSTESSSDIIMTSNEITPTHTVTTLSSMFSPIMTITSGVTSTSIPFSSPSIDLISTISSVKAVSSMFSPIMTITSGITSTSIPFSSPSIDLISTISSVKAESETQSVSMLSSPSAGSPNVSTIIIIATFTIAIVIIGLIVCSVLLFVYMSFWRHSNSKEPQDFAIIFDLEIYKMDSISLASVVTVLQPLQLSSEASIKTAGTTDEEIPGSKQSVSTNGNSSSTTPDEYETDVTNLTEASAVSTDSTYEAVINDTDSPVKKTEAGISTTVPSVMLSTIDEDTNGYVTGINMKPHNKVDEYSDTCSVSLSHYDNTEQYNDITRHKTDYDSSVDNATSEYIHI